MQSLLKTNNQIYGYNNVDFTIPLGPKLVDVALALAETDYQLSSHLTSINPEYIIPTSKSFYENKFKLYDIPYASDLMIKSNLHNKEVSSIAELIKLYNESGTLINPFKVPIRYVDKSYLYGTISFQIPNILEDDFLKQISLFVRWIELSKQTTIFSPVSYVHEIMHLELTRIKGSITNYLHSELLSIFIELVYAYENNQDGILLRQVLINRLNYFLYEFDNLFKYYYEKEKGLDEYQASISSKYLVSILMALNLFDLYTHSPNSIKKEILNKIQQVLDGSKKLEDILNELDVSYDNSLDSNLFIKQLQP